MAVDLAEFEIGYDDAEGMFFAWCALCETEVFSDTKELVEEGRGVALEPWARLGI